jgi:hypothetical protein
VHYVHLAAIPDFAPDDMLCFESVYNRFSERPSADAEHALQEGPTMHPLVLRKRFGVLGKAK